MACPNGQWRIFIALQRTLRRGILPRTEERSHSLQRPQQSQPRRRRQGCRQCGGRQPRPSVFRGTRPVRNSVFREHAELSGGCHQHEAFDIRSF